ncbi:MAG: cysteine hydrolase family protein [Slackia sp.]
MIDSSSTALVMIDMQNGFINETSPLCVAGAKKSISACKRVLEYARQNAVPVYHIVRRYAADGSDVEPCRYDTWKDERPLSNVCPEEIGPSEPAELAPLEGEAVIVKPRFSAFFQTDLHARLQKQGIDTLLLTGTTTPNCIRSTCYDALSYNYDVIVVEDATSSRNEDVQRANMEDMAFIGARIIRSVDL